MYTGCRTRSHNLIAVARSRDNARWHCYRRPRLKILHLNNEKTWRGGERQTLLLARALHGCGVGTAIACRPNAPLEGYARQQGVPTLALSANPFGALVDLGRAASRYDLLHCHTARTHSLATLTAAWSHKPVLVTRRVDFAVPPTRFNRYKYSRASRVVCVSAHIANQLRDWGVPTAKLAVIRDAVPTRPHATTDQVRALREELQVPAGMKVVGNIAALVGHKDHATLLRAAQAVTRQRTDVVFLIIGDGDLRDDLHRQQRELGLDESVRFLGFLPEAERFLPAFDVFVMSSHMEGLGSIVLDAFAADVPVAATAGGGLPELVKDAETGLLVPVGDAAELSRAIGRLLDEPALTAKLRAGARSWVSTTVSVEQMAQNYLELYRAVLAGSKARD
jgi:glycosyltransferase involved in cell wall biosynthesis